MVGCLSFWHKVKAKNIDYLAEERYGGLSDVLAQGMSEEYRLPG